MKVELEEDCLWGNSLSYCVGTLMVLGVDPGVRAPYKFVSAPFSGVTQPFQSIAITSSGRKPGLSSSPFVLALDQFETASVLCITWNRS
jgi:hypothetical protein